MGKQKKHGAKKFEEYYGKPYIPGKEKERDECIRENTI